MVVHDVPNAYLYSSYSCLLEPPFRLHHGYADPLVNCYFAVTIHTDQAIKKGLLTTTAPVLAQLLSLLQVLENVEKA